MVTLEQARKIVEDGESLLSELSHIDRRLEAFRRSARDTVECRAYVDTGDAFGRSSSAYATLLPVAKSVAISALERERAKVVSKLAELGVTVTHNLES